MIGAVGVSLHTYIDSSATDTAWDHTSLEKCCCCITHVELARVARCGTTDKVGFDIAASIICAKFREGAD